MLAPLIRPSSLLCELVRTCRNFSPVEKKIPIVTASRELAMNTYTVRSGDTLWAIAKRHGVSLGALEAANPQIRNPDLIFPGQAVRIPDRFSPASPQRAPVNLSGGDHAGTYTVRPGDTLSGIAARFGTTYQHLAAVNRISNPNLIYAGQVLHLGGNPGLAPPTPSHASPSPSSHSAPPGKTGGWNPGPGRLDGADTSHYQSSGTFEQSIRGSQWSAIKATEGTGYVDPTFRARWNELGRKIDAGQMTLRVAYQFMRPGNGTAQAQHFLNTLGIHGKLPAGTRLALDWEADALHDPGALHDAANYIHNVTGVWPLIYTSASQVSRARAAAPQAPIWEAKWGGSVPSNVPFVQYSDGPGYDHDVFNGDLAALRRFAGF
jgi:spore coat assembly protein SafA